MLSDHHTSIGIESSPVRSCFQRLSIFVEVYTIKSLSFIDKAKTDVLLELHFVFLINAYTGENQIFELYNLYKIFISRAFVYSKIIYTVYSLVTWVKLIWKNEPSCRCLMKFLPQFLTATLSVCFLFYLNIWTNFLLSAAWTLLLYSLPAPLSHR